MVYRLFVEKKAGLDYESARLKDEIKDFLQIDALESVRIIKRYDVENIDRALFEYCKDIVFSQPQLDNVYESLVLGDCTVIAVELLSGQFDQRADSCAQCIQVVSQKEKPLVRTANIYALYGKLSDKQIANIKKHLINPVECKEATMDKYQTLQVQYDIPAKVQTLSGFNGLNSEGLQAFVADYGLAMDIDDISLCQSYFVGENREPTITEIRMIDTYWSDHCRHTTFLTTIDSVQFEDAIVEKSYQDYLASRAFLDRSKPINLMDIATIIVKVLRKQGKLDKLDQSAEINACTVKIKVDVEGEKQDWLLLFKNETHNHPTEIEPFGGAATCVGGAIRDPLSGRAYVYGAMRITGAGNPLADINDTLEGKLPQRKIVTTAADGYSSYGNQIGVATGLVDEIYHDGYVAKRMELGAVIGAVPSENVRREVPKDGDVIILLGGRTGRDGCGGATGSSKSHTLESLETCGAEVQKGNAPEERKLQRLFRNKTASQLIKRCNDFGAGGVSVAIGELADGIEIDLNKVPTKYDGLDGTELAISESQERMAVVVDKKDAEKFINLAQSENLEATVVAKVTEQKRLIMYWNGDKIVDIDRTFLNSNGAEKHIDITVEQSKGYAKEKIVDFADGYKALADDLNICCKKGLAERFDCTAGAGSVLMPFGGKHQLTPVQAMVHKVAVEEKHTDTCSVMAYGYNPFIAEKSPYHGAYLAVVESVSKLIATGASFDDVYLTFQEYFERLGKDEKKWGQPLAALLGAYQAQKDLDIAAIGGKDSMSGSFENLNVPPTLVSFAVTTTSSGNIISNEFKKSGSKVVLLKPEYDSNGLPNAKSLITIYHKVSAMIKEGAVISCYTPTLGGIAEAIMKMCFGNNIGFVYDDKFSLSEIFDYNYGAFILELAAHTDIGICLGETSANPSISYKKSALALDSLLNIYQGKLEKVYPSNTPFEDKKIEIPLYYATDKAKFRYPKVKPRVLIPVFSGNTCEYETKKAWLRAGASTEIFIINNLTSDSLAASINSFADKLRNAQVLFIPSGLSCGDEPDGTAKLITAFFRNRAVSDATNRLLKQSDGLICGISNGFQALIKLGLVPYGEIVDIGIDSPTLTYNTLGKHKSTIVRTKVMSNKSPWLSKTCVGEVYNVAISHGEGRFYASESWLQNLAANGQIATAYVDFDGNATYDAKHNIHNSAWAIEGITSPDGRVLGKMGHSERVDTDLYKNVIGNYDIQLFDSAVEYFS